jgi:hypothetical protein
MNEIWISKFKIESALLSKENSAITLISAIGQASFQRKKKNQISANY